MSKPIYKNRERSIYRVDKIAKEGKGRIVPHERGGNYIYVSKDVASDSSFPFEEGENVQIEIKEDEIHIKKK